MNGRLYDPLLHRFFSPDNYVQDPGNTQNYNRYGYVYNSPLRYTDPSGELIRYNYLNGNTVHKNDGGGDGGSGYFNRYQSQWDLMDRARAGDPDALAEYTRQTDGHTYVWNPLGGEEVYRETKKDKSGRDHTYVYYKGAWKESTRNQGRIGDTDNWFGNFLMARKLTQEWDSGTGPSRRVFYNDNVAKAMSNAHGVNLARDYFYSEVNKGRNVIKSPITGVKGAFGLIGMIRAGIDPIEQFVGTYRIESIIVKKSMLQFTITNRTSLNSFLYDKGPAYDRNTFRFGGNTFQTYIFTEPINYSRITNSRYVK